MTVRMLVIPKDDYIKSAYKGSPPTASAVQLATVAWCYAAALPEAEKPLVCEMFNTINFAHDGRYAVIANGDEIAPFYAKLRAVFPALPDRPFLIGEFPHGSSNLTEDRLAPLIGHVAARVGWSEPPQFVITGPMMRLAIPSFEMGAKFRLFWTAD